ncbi:MAG: hypothetical protein V9H25_03365 [Candidatus Competibacter sp.]
MQLLQFLGRFLEPGDLAAQIVVAFLLDLDAIGDLGMHQEHGSRREQGRGDQHHDQLALPQGAACLSPRQ